MTTTYFCGHKTGFNPKGGNDAIPNEFGSPVTNYCGRGALPEGKLKLHPGEVADISGGNRRLAKAKHGAGPDGVTVFKGSSAFGNKGRGTGSGRKPGGMGGGSNRDYDRK